MQRAARSNRTRFTKPSTIPGLSLLTADFSTHRYPPHSHDAYVVAVTESGGACFSSRGVDQEAQPRHLLVFNPEEPHAGHMGRSPSWRYRGFYLSETAARDLSSALESPDLGYFLENVVIDRELIGLFAEVHRDLTEDPEREPDVMPLQEAFGMLFARHASAKRRPARPPRDRRLALRAREALRDRFRESFRLADLARDLGLTPYQLSRLFRRNFDLGPRDYLIHLRLADAIGRLKEGLPLAQTAVESGFYDQSAMHFHFKRCYGITPSQYLTATGQASRDRSIEGRNAGEITIWPQLGRTRTTFGP